MNIGVYTNLKKDVGLAVTRKLVSLLTAEGYDVVLFGELAPYGLSKFYFDLKSKKSFDVLVTVGGDGTILRVAPYCAENDIAVLGVNLGTVGFMTEIELNAIEEAVKLLKNGEFVAEKRSMLKAEMDGVSRYALNDVVISRNCEDRMITVSVSVDGFKADKYSCDGYIVSTPTGSTAYSLSAGGCVLSPDLKALSLLPINSHSLHSRPIVASDSSKIVLTLHSTENGCSVIADGMPIGRLNASESIEIVRAEKSLTFLKHKDSNFYEKLLTKLNAWSVTPG